MLKHKARESVGKNRPTAKRWEKGKSILSTRAHRPCVRHSHPRLVLCYWPDACQNSLNRAGAKTPNLRPREQVNTGNHGATVL